MTQVSIRYDCKYYIGEKPCKFKRECENCSQYLPMHTRILIIKLSAIGDVLRTTPILEGLKKKYPNSYITWVVSESSRSILENNPCIDSLLTLDWKNALVLKTQKFHLIACLEKTSEATALAMELNGIHKMGFGMTEYGTLYALNKESEYALKLGVSDNLKFVKNRLSYPEIVFQMLGLEFQEEKYVLNIPGNNRKVATGFASTHELNKNDYIIGLNTGAGTVFATKKWTVDGFVKLSELIHHNLNAKILLYGGPLEKERNSRIMKQSNAPIIDTGCNNSIMDFTALLGLCNMLVTSDTMAMHIGIALEKTIIALIGATCEQEIHLYGLGEKIVSDFDCSPCYLQKCNKNPTCMDSITPEQVFESIKRWIPK